MRLTDGHIQLAPTDLGPHLECAHATACARAFALGAGPGPAGGGDYQELIRTKGDLHEARVLARLREAGIDIVEIPRTDEPEQAQELTLRAMRAGAQAIAQATFVRDGWSGRADILERVDTPTALGGWGYEAVDAKLARNEALPHHVLQLGVYSEWIAQVQGVPPRHMHLELGSGRRETIVVADVAAYVRHARARLRAAVTDAPPTEPVRCSHCAVCGFRKRCETWWFEHDDLNQVAGLRRDQAIALRHAGVPTLTQLAQSPDELVVADLAPRALEDLRHQAQLQLQARRDKTLPFDLRPAEERRGLGRLPAPDPADIFLDLEGDPFWDPARELWFLFGYVILEDGQWRYVDIWAHTPQEEGEAFGALVDVMTARRATAPDMHVYHYSPAEPSALRRLASQPSSRESQMDQLLRQQVFVDLFHVARQALVVGAPSYGLKTVERLAGFTRGGVDVSGGDEAVLAYERWRDDGDGDRLDQIARYNEQDCLATLALRDWLLEIRDPQTPWWTVAGDEDEPAPAPNAVEAERAALRESLLRRRPASEATRLAGELLAYHRHEARPAWWAHFARLEMDGDQLLGDSGAMVGLAPTAREPQPVDQSLEYELTYPEQNHGIGMRGGLDHASGKGVVVTHVDDDARTLRIKRGKNRVDEPLPTALVPPTPLDTKAHRAALTRFAESVRDGGTRYRALQDLLLREPPRTTARSPWQRVQTDDVDEQIAIALGLRESTLVVQGPPGTGKTWLGGRMIVALIAAGKRVGVCATSHKAVNNLLGEVVQAADELGVRFRGCRKSDGPETAFDGRPDLIENVSNLALCEDPMWQLVAGTSWLMVREALDQAFDVLVIDEAGQMALADAVASGRSARSLILLGDPLQLPHVSQAVHVPGVDASVLGHLLGDDATVPPERGLFLTTTRRMHPEVCRFVSQELYEGRLRSHPHCARQGVDGQAGIRFVPVAHEGRSTASREERDAIATEVTRLIGLPFTDFRGETRPITTGDIMVVAPYNAQVRLLRAGLPDGVRIGTVDKFQGQEAPIVFFSMATSSGDQMPRDASFLFSRNRLNVAISRARCLAYLVCSPALLDATVRTVDDMRLISTLCALVEEAE